MNVEIATQRLDQEWEQEPGYFFFDLKMGVFVQDEFERVKALLMTLDVPEQGDFDRRFIEVIWFIPTFMRWQRDAWVMDGKDTTDLDNALSFVEQRLTSILGLP